VIDPAGEQAGTPHWTRIGGEEVARNGSKWLDYALAEAAMAAIRVRAGYPAAQYRRLKPDAVTRRRSAPSSTR
jgi:hypothetical protein